jgi:hypothetical protein
MKKIIVFLTLVSSFNASVFSQSNNPRDIVGINFKNQAEYLINEKNAGRITNSNKVTVGKYAKELNYSSDLPVNQIIGQTYQTLTAPEFNFSSFVNNSDISQSVKNEMIDIYNAQKNTTVDNFKNFIVNKVSQINANSSLVSNDKTSILDILSVTFHSLELPARAEGLANPNEEGTQLPNTPIYIGIAAGGIIGGAICGAPCVAVGMLVGGLIGAMVQSWS